VDLAGAAGVLWRWPLQQHRTRPSSRLGGETLSLRQERRKTMARIEKSILVHASVEDVYAVARDPNRWPDWFVGMTTIDKLTGVGKVGTVAEFGYTMAGMRFPVAVEVLEDHLGSDGGRWKGKIVGPLAGEQTWTYTPKEDATEVSVDLEYTVPGKALGQIANRLLIERQQERSADQTLQNLKALCEAG
jgi:ribosome-associated toxin RatA of RatAB toxin-antitoxin module